MNTIVAARVVILVAFLDLFIQFPVVAPFARSLGATASQVGLVVAAYSGTNLVGNLLAGAALDWLGRTRPVLAGLLLTMLALAAYAVVRTPDELLAVRAVHGLAAAALTPGAFALIGDSSNPGHRVRAMGSSGALIAAAAIVGPPLAGLVRDRLGVGAVFLGGALLMAVAAIVFGLVAREARAGHSSSAVRRPALSGYLALWVRPRLAAAYLAALALTVGLGSLVVHLPLVLAARGEPASRSGLAFTIFAVVAILVMAGPLNRLGDRYGRARPAVAGLVLVGAGLLVLGLAAGSAGGVGLGMAVFGLGFGLLFPSAAALVADAADREERGAAYGIFYAVYSLGVVIGSTLSGILGDWFGDLSGAPFLAAAAVALLAWPPVLLLGRHAARPARAPSPS